MSTHKAIKDQIVDILSEKTEPRIISDLINAYVAMKDDYIKKNYDEVQSKSGKFIENVFRLLKYASTEKFVQEINSGGMNKITNELKKLNNNDCPERMRILMPIIASSIYQQRSKLGSVHQKPLSPDFIDAKLTIASSDWIVAEFLRHYDDRDANKTQNLIYDVVKECVPIIQTVGEEIFVDATVKCDDEILIRLYYCNGGLTRRELGKAMRMYPSPSTITKALTRLKQSKKIFYTQSQKYVLAESSRSSTACLIAQIVRDRK